MKISNLQILNPMFMPALEKLLRREMPLSLCEALANCITEIDNKGSVVQKVRAAVIDKYLVKDAQGKPVIVDGNKPQFKSPEDTQKFLAEVTELAKGGFEVTFDKKIDISEDEKMPAQEYLLIKDFVNIVKKATGPVDISKK